MVNFFQAIISFLDFIFTYVQHIVSSIISAVSILYTAIPLPSYLLGLVPSIVGASIALVVGVGVLKMLVGWGNV